MAGRTYVRKGQIVTDRNLLEQKAIELGQVAESMSEHGNQIMWGGSRSDEWAQSTSTWLMSLVYHTCSNFNEQPALRDQSGPRYIAMAKVVLDAEPVVMVANNLRAVRVAIESDYELVHSMRPYELLQNQANVLMAWAKES
jgi:hypothetical protein